MTAEPTSGSFPWGRGRGRPPPPNSIHIGSDVGLGRGELRQPRGGALGVPEADGVREQGRIDPAGQRANLVDRGVEDIRDRRRSDRDGPARGLRRILGLPGGRAGARLPGGDDLQQGVIAVGRVARHQQPDRAAFSMILSKVLLQSPPHEQPPPPARTGPAPPVAAARTARGPRRAPPA